MFFFFSKSLVFLRSDQKNYEQNFVNRKRKRWKGKEVNFTNESVEMHFLKYKNELEYIFGLCVSDLLRKNRFLKSILVYFKCFSFLCLFLSYKYLFSKIYLKSNET